MPTKNAQNIPIANQQAFDCNLKWNKELYRKIKQTKIFHSLSNADLLILALYAKVCKVKAHTVLFNEGEDIPNLYLILDGNIDITLKDRVINSVGFGESIGEISLVDSMPASASAKTKSQCTLLIISKAEFLQVMEKEPVLGNKILWRISVELACRLRRSSNNLVLSMNDTDKMASEKNKAIEVGKEKDLQLANMTHELRTPIAAIIGYVELLKEDIEADDVETNDGGFLPDLEKVRLAGIELLTLINNTLDLSKIEAGKMELNMENIELKPFFEDIVIATKPLVQKNNNQLIYHTNDIETIYGDRTRLKQIFYNLLSNSCKFTKNGEITVTLSHELNLNNDQQEDVIIKFKDTGIGMEQDQVQKLFAPYSQATSKISEQYGGTGLGLAISKKLCQLMGGNISVTSQFNHGTCFQVQLPT